MNLLITGGRGFVGGAIQRKLRTNATYGRVVAVSRSESDSLGSPPSPNLSSAADWRPLLCGVHAIVHCAARVHVMNDRVVDPLAEFRKANATGTIALARQAAEAGVRRFIFMSSIKVNGEQTDEGRPFLPDDIAAPQDAYAVSKTEAEAALRRIAAETDMEIVIIRAPLVYGPGVKGNFSMMMRAVARGVPLPFGAVTSNCRSLVAIDNLVDLVVTCIDHPAAANQTFLVSDDEDLSTADLLRRLGAVMGKPARLLNIPPVLLGAAAAMVGKRAVAQRLLGNLQVDISHTCRTLGWKPPVSVDEGLRRAVQGAMR